MQKRIALEKLQCDMQGSGRYVRVAQLVITESRREIELF